VQEAKLDQDGALARALYSEHAGPLHAYASRMLGGDRHLAEDIVQETLLRAWRHHDQLEVQTARPWLLATARRLVIDLYRRRKARPVEVSAVELERITSSDGIDAALDAVLIMDALASLSPAHRHVIIESYYRGHTVAQIATDYGLPPGTVRSRIHYALRALRLALLERGVST
jgi:RNA polymerase sigma-70 factor (ECF subfamily)